MRYIRQKVVQLIFTVLAVTILTFLLLSLLPGDRAVAIGGIVGGENAEAYYDQVREQWGLNDPLIVQYFTWLKNAVTGDLGVSSAFNVPVSDLVTDRLPVSLSVMVYTIILALLISIPLGTAMAYRANTVVDRSLSTGAFALLSIPNYILGVLLVYLFAFKLGWLPATSDYVPLLTSPTEHFRSLALPVITLTLGLLAVFTRLLRADMIATLQNDFITLARAKGMPTRTILFRHALRPSLFSLITAAAINVGALIGGAVIVEQIFALPGMGSLTVEAIFRRDFLTVQICVVIFSVIFVLVNFLVDVLYAVIDPRIRHARALA
jgi:peptide/nickel transport system permease protein